MPHISPCFDVRVNVTRLPSVVIYIRTEGADQRTGEKRSSQREDLEVSKLSGNGLICSSFDSIIDLSKKNFSEGWSASLGFGLEGETRLKLGKVENPINANLK